MKLEFSLLARQDMREIADYLRANFPGKEKRTRQEIVDACETVLRHPLLGRTRSEPDTRELILPRLPYRIIYQVAPDRIFIVRVYHTSRHPLS